MDAVGMAPAEVAALKALLPVVADHTVAAVVSEVPPYAEAFAGPMGDTIRGAVQLALAGFLDLAAEPGGTDSPAASALEGAYALGRGEARAARTADALLSAYRVGARVAWRELSAESVRRGASAGTLARFAELVFAYIDELSAASLAGHADELEVSGRVRQRHLDRLANALLAGEPPTSLEERAEVAGWTPPETLTAVLLPEDRVRGLFLDPATLHPTEDLPERTAVLLVPDADRGYLLRQLAGRDAVVGPARPWESVRASYDRALRARSLGLLGSTEDHLAALVLTADPPALSDLRAHALAPLDPERPSSREKLEETLRAWLLHQGRREDVAAALFVHPQTVRYRVGRLRELYGERLADPAWVLLLTLALGLPSAHFQHDGQ
jgi:hypothetical protein